MRYLLGKDPIVIITSFFITFIFIGVSFYISILFFLIMDALFICGLIMFIVIFGNLTDVWNIYFFYIFGLFLCSPYISKRYSTYWFFISLSLGFHLPFLFFIFLGRSAYTILAMFCKVSNTVTYETNKYFSIRDVGFLFLYHPFIFFFDSTIIILMTKLVIAMTISIECMFGESLVFRLVMTFFFCMSSEIFHLRTMSRIMITGLFSLWLFCFLGVSLEGTCWHLTFSTFSWMMELDPLWLYPKPVLSLGDICN